RARWLRYVLRGGRDERALELQLPAVQPQRDGDGRGERGADQNARRFLSGCAIWHGRRYRWLESAAARGSGGTRSALEHRLSAGALHSYDARDQLCGDQRLASAAGGEHQPAAGRARQRPDAPPVPAVRQSEHPYAGDVEPVSRAAGKTSEARVRWFLVSP